MANDSILIQVQLGSPTRANINAVTKQIQSALSNVSANVQIQNGRQAAQTLQNIKKGADGASRSMNSFGEAIGLSARRFVAFTSAVAVVGRLTAALSQATREAIKFEREFVKLAQVFDTDVKALRSLQNSISGLAQEFGLSATVIAKTSVVLAQSGLSARETEQAMKALAKTTLAATFDSLASSTEGAVAIMAQFGTEASKLETQLGAINAVSKRFAVESGDIIEAVRRAGGAFKAAKGNLNDFIALFTAVRSTTRESAETIATGFRTIFARIQRPKTIEFFRQLNIELTDGRGNFIGAFEAIRRLSQGLERAGIQAGSLRFASVVEQLGGIRQVSRVIPLLQKFTKAERARQVAEQGGASLDRDAAKAQQTLAQAFARTTENFRALIREISQTETFQAMVRIALDLANALIEVARSLKPLIPLLATLGAVKIGGLASGALKKGFGGAGGTGGLGRGFKRGGPVPGTGSGDTVPAMLEPGEFVIRKSAVQAFGAGNLAGINKYAKGDRVKPDATGYVKADKRGLSQQSIKFSDIDNDKNLSPSAKGAVKGILLERLLRRRIGRTQAAPDERPDFPRLKDREKKILRVTRRNAEVKLRKSGGVPDPNTTIVHGFNKGGAVGTDTVPALLTPGEFVVNKESAKTFGYGNLRKINKYNKGGVVGVQKFKGGGSVKGGGGMFGDEFIGKLFQMSFALSTVTALLDDTEGTLNPLTKSLATLAVVTVGAFMALKKIRGFRDDRIARSRATRGRIDAINRRRVERGKGALSKRGLRRLGGGLRLDPIQLAFTVLAVTVGTVTAVMVAQSAALQKRVDSEVKKGRQLAAVQAQQIKNTNDINAGVVITFTALSAAAIALTGPFGLLVPIVLGLWYAAKGAEGVLASFSNVIFDVSKVLIDGFVGAVKSIVELINYVTSFVGLDPIDTSVFNEMGDALKSVAANIAAKVSPAMLGLKADVDTLSKAMEVASSNIIEESQKGTERGQKQFDIAGTPAQKGRVLGVNLEDLITRGQRFDDTGKDFKAGIDEINKTFDERVRKQAPDSELKAELERERKAKIEGLEAKRAEQLKDENEARLNNIAVVMDQARAVGQGNAAMLKLNEGIKVQRDINNVITQDSLQNGSELQRMFEALVASGLKEKEALIELTSKIDGTSNALAAFTANLSSRSKTLGGFLRKLTTGNIEDRIKAGRTVNQGAQAIRSGSLAQVPASQQSGVIDFIGSMFSLGAVSDQQARAIVNERVGDARMKEIEEAIKKNIIAKNPLETEEGIATAVAEQMKIVVAGFFGQDPVAAANKTANEETAKNTAMLAAWAAAGEVPVATPSRAALIAQPRANGGSIVNFKPKGTDTVPAMLTPGEFVVRKPMVDKYGSGMMKSINAGTYAGGGIVSYLSNGGSTLNKKQIEELLAGDATTIKSKRIFDLSEVETPAVVLGQKKPKPKPRSGFDKSFDDFPYDPIYEKGDESEPGFGDILKHVGKRTGISSIIPSYKPGSDKKFDDFPYDPIYNPGDEFAPPGMMNVVDHALKRLETIGLNIPGIYDSVVSSPEMGVIKRAGETRFRGEFNRGAPPGYFSDFSSKLPPQHIASTNIHSPEYIAPEIQREREIRRSRELERRASSQELYDQKQQRRNQNTFALFSSSVNRTASEQDKIAKQEEFKRETEAFNKKLAEARAKRQAREGEVAIGNESFMRQLARQKENRRRGFKSDGTPISPQQQSLSNISSPEITASEQRKRARAKTEAARKAARDRLKKRLETTQKGKEDRLADRNAKIKEIMDREGVNRRVAARRVSSAKKPSFFDGVSDEVKAPFRKILDKATSFSNMFRQGKTITKIKTITAPDGRKYKVEETRVIHPETGKDIKPRTYVPVNPGGAYTPLTDQQFRQGESFYRQGQYSTERMRDIRNRKMGLEQTGIGVGVSNQFNINNVAREVDRLDKFRSRRGFRTRHSGGMIPGFAERPLYAQGGEFVMQRSAVNRIGAGNLHYMNNGGNVPANGTMNVMGGESISDAAARLENALSNHTIPETISVQLGNLSVDIGGNVLPGMEIMVKEAIAEALMDFENTKDTDNSPGSYGRSVAQERFGNTA